MKPENFPSPATDIHMDQACAALIRLSRAFHSGEVTPLEAARVVTGIDFYIEMAMNAYESRCKRK